MTKAKVTGNKARTPKPKPKLQVTASLEDIEIQPFVDRITSAYWQGVDSVLDMAKACADAVAKLKDEEQQKRLLRLLDIPMTEATFSKHVKVGNVKWLHAPDLRPSLPQGLTILYELSFLTDEQAKAAIANRTIQPKLSRQEAHKLRQGNRSPAKKADYPSDDGKLTEPETSESRSPAPYAVITLPSQVDCAVLVKVRKLLDEIASFEDITVTYPWEAIGDDNMRRQDERQHRVHSRLIKIVKREIGREVAERVSKRKSPKMPKATFLRKMGWSFDDTLRIDPDDGEDRIREVLGLLGIEHRLDDLITQAESEVRNTKLHPLDGYPEIIGEIEPPALPSAWLSKKKVIDPKAVETFRFDQQDPSIDSR